MAIFTIISDKTSCFTPENLIISNITNDGFLVEWDSNLINVEYEVSISHTQTSILSIDNDLITIDNDLITIDTTTSSGILIENTYTTTDKFLLLNGLQNNTEYIVKVRTKCSSSSFSNYTPELLVITIDEEFDFLASNNNITVDNNNIRISELQITQSEI